jgi:hypothetical protein
VRQHWARTRAGLVSTAFQHAILGSRRRNLALDAAVDHFDDPNCFRYRFSMMPIILWLQVARQPHIVMPGLDPGIYHSSKRMDRQVEPGNDEFTSSLPGSAR